MLQQVIENVNGKPQVASADTGYWSAANVTAENLQGIDLVWSKNSNELK
jgi:hypothetical protein